MARLAARIEQALQLAILPLLEIGRVVRMIGHKTFDHLIERPARKLDGDIGGAFEFERTRVGNFDGTTHPIRQIRGLAQGFESVASIEQHAKTRS